MATASSKEGAVIIQILYTTWGLEKVEHLTYHSPSGRGGIYIAVWLLIPKALSLIYSLQPALL